MSRLACIACWVLATIIQLHVAVAEEWSGHVVSMIDGDTVRVLRDGHIIKIRLYGIDCPEITQDHGATAHHYIANLIQGKIVTVTEMDMDRYGRPVALLEASGKNINREMIAAGMAWVFTRYCQEPYRTEWRALEANARQ